jgi:threonine aldolase
MRGAAWDEMHLLLVARLRERRGVSEALPLFVRSGSVPRRLSVLAFTRERNSGGCSSGSHFRERRSGSCAIVGSGQGVFADNLDGVVAQLAARFGISEITGSRAALGGRCF